MNFQYINSAKIDFCVAEMFINLLVKGYEYLKVLDKCNKIAFQKDKTNLNFHGQGIMNPMYKISQDLTSILFVNFANLFWSLVAIFSYLTGKGHIHR